MRLTRHNHVAEIEGAPGWFLSYLARHLSVEVPVGTDPGIRFGIVWSHEGARYGSLVRDRTVAAGLTPHVEALAHHYRESIQVVDARQRPADGLPLWSVAQEPRPYQERAHRAILRHSVGVVDAPPRSGKTLMAARAIDSHGLPTVYVAPSVQIVRQTYERFVGIFGADLVARLDGSAKPHEKDPEKFIVVTTAASATRMPPEWWDARDVLIIDEFHHAAASTYHRINTLAKNVFFRFGFTGTHFRTGGDALAMEAVCSHVLERIELAELVPRWVAPAHVFFAPFYAPSIGAVDWRLGYQRGIVDCEQRNDLVVRAASMMLANGVPTLVLTRRRAHADALGERIPDSLVVKGGENALTTRSIGGFLEGRVNCLIGTTVIGEGVDVPRAGALIYASGGSDGVAMAQSYYRPLTAHPGKAVGRIYDFADTHHGTLRRHASNRIAMARDLFGPDHVHSGRR